MKLTTTLNRLKDQDACPSRYKHLLGSLGGPSADHDAPINLLYILDTNGLDDALWALQATVEDSSAFARLLACDYAERVLPIWERQFPTDERPRKAIETARKFAHGEATQQDLISAGLAARAAADATWAWCDAAAAASVARAAAIWWSASAAAVDSAWIAARAAAAGGTGAVSWKAERAEQERMLRERLQA